MSCRIGQDIYRLRRKNRELLQQLESNSVLLQNRIKVLRRAARTPIKTDGSPLKRRNSNRIGDAIDDISSSSSTNSCSASFVHKHKKTMKDTKNSPAKRIKRNVCKPGKNTQCNGKVKMSVSGTRCVIQRRDDCFCPDSPKKTPKGKVPGKSKSSVDTNESKKKVPCSLSDADLDKSDFSDEFPKSLEEACCVLTYTPDSVFLRRMKQRLEKWKKSQGKENIRRKNVCDCNEVDMPASSDSSLDNAEVGGGDYSKTKGKSAPENTCSKQDSKSSESVKCQKKNASRKGFDSSVGSVKFRVPRHSKQMCKGKLNNKDNPKEVRVQSKEIVDSGCRSSHGKCCCEIAEPRASSAPASKGSSNNVKKTKSKIGKTKASAPPVDEGPKTCVCEEPEPVGLDRALSPVQTEPEHEERPLHLRPQLPSQVQCAGYDVIAGLVENERQKRMAESCPLRFEELNEFRRRHWFDCHAHPHNMCERCGGSGDLQPGTLGWDRGVQTPRETCTRTYILNSRLFPEPLSEAHVEGCCTRCCQPPTSASAAAAPPLASTADDPVFKTRNEVTLPVLTPRYTEVSPDTITYPPGVKVYTKPRIVVRDVQRSVPVVKSLRDTPARNVRPLGVPVPANSLALRFQKGVV